MQNFLIQFLASLISSSLVMKHNLDWHRKLVAIFVPLFIIFMYMHGDYVVRRIQNNRS